MEDCVNFTNSAFEQQRHGNGCIGLAAENAAALRVFENFGQMRCCPNNGLSSEWMAAAAASNTTLLKYFYPEDPLDAFVKGEIEKTYRPITKGCNLAPNACWCFHVRGSPIKAENPDAWKESDVGKAIDPAATKLDSKKRQIKLHRDLYANIDASSVNASSFVPKAAQVNDSCSCLVPLQPPPQESTCLFSDMRPGKLLAVITACRRLGITHIIEEGRFGGLSALIYAIHGFKVTSIELLPIDFVGRSLKSAAPGVIQVEGDGAVLVPQLVAKARRNGERVAVIFDGEKRRAAYKTYEKVRDQIHLVVFDDSYHENFHRHLDRHEEVAWHTNLDRTYANKYGTKADITQLAPFEQMLKRAAVKLKRQQPDLFRLKDPVTKKWIYGAQQRLRRLVDKEGRLVLPPGGLQDMAHYHFVLVRGGAWKLGDELW